MFSIDNLKMVSHISAIVQKSVNDVIISEKCVVWYYDVFEIRLHVKSEELKIIGSPSAHSLMDETIWFALNGVAFAYGYKIIEHYKK